mmetsp:Transcript_13659/g.59598  ORF Transcript_13659/g.59598 Transcript_13659/m.59598 type:complete len:229 (+) Transcript_13659:44-730(+)
MFSRKEHQLGAAPSEGTKCTPKRLVSIAVTIKPVPSQTHTSLISSPGSTDVYVLPVSGSHARTTRVSALMMRLCPSLAPCHRTSTILKPFMWSFVNSGRDERRSYRRTLPSASPVANRIPLGSKRTDVTPSPEPSAPPAHTRRPPPRRSRERRSKHSTVPFSVPHANRPWVLDTLAQFTPVAFVSRGDKNRPCSRLRRYTSCVEPTTTRSPVCSAYAMARPCRGNLVL